MSEDKLNALGMLSMEKKLARDSPNFNNSVMERFANLKARRSL